MRNAGEHYLFIFVWKYGCFAHLREIHAFEWGSRDTGILCEKYFLFLSFQGKSMDFIWETEILVFIFLFLRWIKGYVDIENRIFCSRGRGRKGWIWDNSVMKSPSNLLSNVEKWIFWCLVRPDPAKIREKSFVWSVRSSRTPLDLPNFNLNYSLFTFYRFFCFPSFSQVH